MEYLLAGRRPGGSRELDMFPKYSVMETSGEDPHPISGEGWVNDSRKSHLLSIVVAVPGGAFQRSSTDRSPRILLIYIYETFILKLVEGQLRKNNSKARQFSEKDRPR